MWELRKVDKSYNKEDMKEKETAKLDRSTTLKPQNEGLGPTNLGVGVERFTV